MARGKRYPAHKIDEALLAHYTLGSYENAGTATGTPPDTIRYWVTVSHTERYDELAAKHGPKLERQVVAKLARTAERAANVIDAGLQATHDAIAQGNTQPPQRDDHATPEDYEAAFRTWATLKANAAKDANSLSSAAKNAALVLGIATDKKLTLEGRPTVITEHRDADDILRSLDKLVPGLVIDSTAQDVTQTKTLNQGTPSGAIPSGSLANARGPQSA